MGIMAMEGVGGRETIMMYCQAMRAGKIGGLMLRARWWWSVYGFRNLASG